MLVIALINAIVSEDTGKISESKSSIISFTSFWISTTKWSKTLDRLCSGKWVYAHKLRRKVFFLKFILFDLSSFFSIVSCFWLNKRLKKFVYFTIVIDIIELTLFFCPDYIHFSEKLVHVLWTKFEVFLHFVNPLMIHFLIIFMHKFLQTIINPRYFLIII